MCGSEAKMWLVTVIQRASRDVDETSKKRSCSHDGRLGGLRLLSGLGLLSSLGLRLRGVGRLGLLGRGVLERSDGGRLLELGRVLLDLGRGGGLRLGLGLEEVGHTRRKAAANLLGLLLLLLDES